MLQCVPLEQVCNAVPNCVDSSDEVACGPPGFNQDMQHTIHPPATVEFDGRGGFHVQKLNGK